MGRDGERWGDVGRYGGIGGGLGIGGVVPLFRHPPPPLRRHLCVARVEAPLPRPERASGRAGLPPPRPRCLSFSMLLLFPPTDAPVSRHHAIGHDEHTGGSSLCGGPLWYASLRARSSFSRRRLPFSAAGHTRLSCGLRPVSVFFFCRRVLHLRRKVVHLPRDGGGAHRQGCRDSPRFPEIPRDSPFPLGSPRLPSAPSRLPLGSLRLPFGFPSTSPRPPLDLPSDHSTGGRLQGRSARPREALRLQGHPCSAARAISGNLG